VRHTDPCLHGRLLFHSVHPIAAPRHQLLRCSSCWPPVRWPASVTLRPVSPRSHLPVFAVPMAVKAHHLFTVHLCAQLDNCSVSWRCADWLLCNHLFFLLLKTH